MNDKTHTNPEVKTELVKDNPAVECALRQAMKDFHGQPFLFDYQLEMTVEQARDEIYAMRRFND